MKTGILIAAMLSAAVLTGCRSAVAFSEEEAGQPIQQKEAKIMKKAGEKLLNALVENDAATFIAELPMDAQAQFGKKDFNQTVESMKRELGKPISYEYVMNLEHPACTISIWKIRFERESSDKKKMIYQESLFRVLSTTQDGKDVIFGFNFL